jgi:hypothetical protein
VSGAAYPFLPGKSGTRWCGDGAVAASLSSPRYAAMRGEKENTGVDLREREICCTCRACNPWVHPRVEETKPAARMEKIDTLAHSGEPSWWRARTTRHRRRMLSRPRRPPRARQSWRPPPPAAAAAESTTESEEIRFF